MFADARDSLVDKASAPPSFDKNSKIETCVLHLRNLIEFFYPNKPQDTDVIARDYAHAWDSERPEIIPVLKEARVRANKEMAHLTSDRKSGQPPGKEWELGKISAALQPVVERFLGVTKLPEEVTKQLRRVGVTASTGNLTVTVKVAEGPVVSTTGYVLSTSGYDSPF